MATYKVINTDFSGGLMSPYLRGRIDIGSYAKGAQQLENFIPQVQGPAHFREGFKFIGNVPSGHTRIISFDIDSKNRFFIVLSDQRLDVYNGDTQELVISHRAGNGTVIPYTADQLDDIRWTREVEKMILTHPEHPPYCLTAGLPEEDYTLISSDPYTLLSSDGYTLTTEPVGKIGTWDFEQMEFTSHPYKKIDTSDTVLRMTAPKEVVRLDSTDASDFNYTTWQIDNMHQAQYAQYVEYKVANQWSLARVLTTNQNDEGVSAPANPTGTTCYVDPVDSVVNIEDPSVRLAMVEGDGDDTWMTQDGVPDGKYHVRADSLIFRTSHINGWVRIGGDNILTNFPTSRTDKSSQDGKIRWGKVVDYRGVEDHPVEFVQDTLRSDDYEYGVVYQVYEWGSQLTDLAVWDSRGQQSVNNRTAYRFKQPANLALASTWRFTMDTSITPNFESGPSDGPSQGRAGLIVANMSTQRQFDVVEVEDVKVEGTRFRTASGTISVYDVVTDPDDLATHTTTIHSSTPLFDSTRDVGRYIQGNLGDGWVTLKIESVQEGDSATCSVLSSVPVSELTGDLLNNGVFLKFRLGAWFIDNWPSTVSFYEQRRVFAGSPEDPNLVWFSKTEDERDFRTVEDDGTVLDTTGITYPLGTTSTAIRWLEAGPTLIAGTDSNEWQLRPNEFSAAITPTNIRITQETGIGSTVQGVRVGSSVFFAQTGGQSFVEFRYDFQSQQFVTTTTTKLVPDLFENEEIIATAFQSIPNSSIWVVTRSGKLFTLTYRKEDDYYAWAQHSTAGDVKALTVVRRGSGTALEDQVWMIVDRDGQNQLEVLSDKFTDSGADNYKENLCFLDSYVRFPETGYFPQSVIGVPPRFGTENISAIIDGVYFTGLSVESGSLVLPDGLTVEKYCLLGLPYTGILQGMPQSWSVSDGNSYGREKRLFELSMYVKDSLGYDLTFPGSTRTDKVRGTGQTLTMGESPLLYTGFTDKHLPDQSYYGVDEAPIIAQTQAYPLDIVSILYKVDLKS